MNLWLTREFLGVLLEQLGCRAVLRGRGGLDPEEESAEVEDFPRRIVRGCCRFGTFIFVIYSYLYVKFVYIVILTLLLL